MFARYDEIPSVTLQDIKESVYKEPIKTYKGKFSISPLALNFICLVHMNVFGKFEGGYKII